MIIMDCSRASVSMQLVLFSSMPRIKQIVVLKHLIIKARGASGKHIIFWTRRHTPLVGDRADFSPQFRLSISEHEHQNKIQSIIVTTMHSLPSTTVPDHTPKTNVWLDCDPGLDDCFAIILAAGHPNLNLLGISTSGGNATVQNTTRNAADVLYHIGKSNVPVYMGARESMKKGTVFGVDIHGEKGLGGVELKPSNVNPITENSFEQIRKRLLEADGPVVWINTGALTNLGILLLICPEVYKKISLVSLMGGAIGKGNRTPAAQFNIYFDPEAAKVVFESGLQVAMVPLEVTHTAEATQQILAAMLQRKSQMSKTLVELILKYKGVYNTVHGIKNPPLHDPCAVFYVLQPQRFVTKKAQVVVDTYPISLGRTNFYFNSEKPNVIVCTSMDVPRFWEVMLALYRDMVPSQ